MFLVIFLPRWNFFSDQNFIRCFRPSWIVASVLTEQGSSINTCTSCPAANIRIQITLSMNLALLRLTSMIHHKRRFVAKYMAGPQSPPYVLSLDNRRQLTWWDIQLRWNSLYGCIIAGYSEDDPGLFWRTTTNLVGLMVIASYWGCQCLYFVNPSWWGLFFWNLILQISFYHICT